MSARPAIAAPAENQYVADRLREAAHLLEAQGASAYRVLAYRGAGEAVAAQGRSVRETFESEGVRGLDAIPRVGLGIASAIAEMLTTGRWSLLERLRGTTEPATLFRTVPGMGPALAARIHDRLHIDSLEALEAAAHDGRLRTVPGVGERRAAAWRAALDSMLGRLRGGRPFAAADTATEPAVGTILDVDHEYREKARAGKLRTIAPRRFNPEGHPWLPLLHAERGPWHFTALFSNTALAHKLDRVRDWVVIYFYDGDHVEHQSTVVTETRGPLAGMRVVRGREKDCLAYYSRPARHELEPAGNAPIPSHQDEGAIHEK
jgi:DNA polymerase (family 10)